MPRLIAAVLLLAAVPAFAQLVPEGATVEKVADGYRFTEGPAAGPDGCIYFTDIPAELILKYDPETGETVTFRENTGAANGLMWFEGKLFMCCHATRHVAYYLGTDEVLQNRINLHGDMGGLFGDGLPTENSIYLIASGGQIWHDANSDRRIEIDELNSPNDLAIDTAGNIYFTDPRYGDRESMTMHIEGLYFSSPKMQNLSNAVESIPRFRLDADLTRPNGIVLSPDESILYVADHGANWIYAYDIVEPGKVENKRQFAQLNNGEGRGSDGMCVDGQGRVYATGHNKVWVFEPSGELVTTIDVGPQTTNCTFAADGKTLYITADHGLFRIGLNTDEPLSSEETE